MKYLILLFSLILATIYVRVQSVGLAKMMYSEGCFDAALKLKKLRKFEEFKQITEFCEWREQSLKDYLKPF